MEDKIIMAHGSGGKATSQLIEEIFAAEFSNQYLNEMEDCAVVKATDKIAMTTDSFVVTPAEYKGGDIGHLAICGTVNDLLMRGATPKYLTCGFILQEGVEVALLKRVVHSMAATAKEAGVLIVAGDTKVVNGNGEFYINTAGVGVFEEDVDFSTKKIEAGDAIIVSGNMGDHHATILSARMGIENNIQSDNAPLVDIVSNLKKAGLNIHAMRDVTRGGLATVLKEMAVSANLTFTVNQQDVPVTPAVKDFCGLMGLDPLYMGNEGKMVVILPQDEADEALGIIKKSNYGQDACQVGRVSCESVSNGKLLMTTSIGGVRNLEVLMGEGLPRIC